ncbi:MAG: hypothetical protein ACOCRO_06145 [Halanaerobiales bacterium]
MESIADLIAWEGQLIIYISCSTISKWEIYEQGTASPENRFKTFNLTNKLNIPTVLYIKPVIPKITKSDVKHFKKVISEYNVKDVVVGSMFSPDKTRCIAPIVDNNLYTKKNNDIKDIIVELSSLSSVFHNSTEVVSKYIKEGC